MKSLLKTVTDLPGTYTAKLSIVTNDSKEAVIGRLIVIMALLNLEDSDIGPAIDCAVHFICSAFLTDQHMFFLRTRIEPLLRIWSRETSNVHQPNRKDAWHYL